MTPDVLAEARFTPGIVFGSEVVCSVYSAMRHLARQQGIGIFSARDELACELPDRTWEALDEIGLFSTVVDQTLVGGDAAETVSASLSAAGFLLLPDAVVSRLVGLFALRACGLPADLLTQLGSAPRTLAFGSSTQFGVGEGLKVDQKGRVYGTERRVQLTDESSHLVAIVSREGEEAFLASIDIDGANDRDRGHRSKLTDRTPVVDLELRGASYERLLVDQPIGAYKMRLAGGGGSAAVVTGVMQAMSQLSGHHTANREQFGRSLSSFQAVSRRLSEMVIYTSQARVLSERAIGELLANRSSGDVCLSAIAYVHRTSENVIRHAHQVHGGVGYANEYPLQSFSAMALRRFSDVRWDLANGMLVENMVESTTDRRESLRDLRKRAMHGINGTAVPPSGSNVESRE